MSLDDKKTQSSVAFCKGLLLFGMILLSQDQAVSREPAASFHMALINGSLIQGEPAVAEFRIDTMGHTQSLPMETVKQLTPGLMRRPKFLKHYQQLVRDFASDDFFTREAACKKMLEIGPEIRGELKDFQNDTDLERRYRARRILKELEKQSISVIWSKQDSIETAHKKFTGKIDLDELTFQTKYGRLQIPLKHISVLRRGTPPQPIDLLKEIDVKRQGIRGRWTMEKGHLTTPPNQAWALMQLNKKPPATYTLHVTAERKTGDDALVFPIVVGQSECNVCLDGWPRGDTHHSGLELIRGEGPLTNETSHKRVLLPTNQPKDIQIDVTPTSVRLLVDQKRIFYWKGDPRVFSMQKGWQRPDTTVLGIGSYNASFQISRLELATQSTLRPLLRASAGDCVIDLQDGSRFVLNPAHQKLEILAQGVMQTIPLKNLVSLARSESDERKTQVKLVDGSTFTGEIQSDRLEFQSDLGTLTVPTHKIKRMARIVEPLHEESDKTR